jgi:hypothetical protein
MLLPSLFGEWRDITGMQFQMQQWIAKFLEKTILGRLA